MIMSETTLPPSRDTGRGEGDRDSIDKVEFKIKEGDGMAKCDQVSNELAAS